MNVWAIKLLLLELVHRHGENTLSLNNQEQHYKAIELCMVNEAAMTELDLLAVNISDAKTV